LAKAKKAEKDLATAKKEHLQREQTVAVRLNQMSTTAGGTYLYFLSFCRLSCSLMLADVFLFCCFAISLVLQNIVKCQC
jgi:hypothetical protein